MSGLYMMATISDRNQARRFLDFYREYGLSVTLLTYGRGTAASEILDAFGLEAAEKAVIFSVVTGEEWKRLKTGLERQIKIDIPGLKLELDVTEEELEKRREAWEPRQPRVTTGYLARYASMVTSGNRGAILEVPKNK